MSYRGFLYVDVIKQSKKKVFSNNFTLHSPDPLLKSVPQAYPSTTK